MSNPTHHPENPEESDPAGVGEALRRDARRIEEAPFDRALHRETMARVREMSEGGRPRFRLGFAPALALGAAMAAIVVLFISFLFKPSPDPGGTPIAEVAPLREAAPRASVWSYERAMAQGDAAFSAALDRDAQVLLPVTAKLPDGLL